MGRVRPKHVKRLARSLVDEHEDMFSKDFDENKEALKDLDVVDSKKFRNRVAGYIIRVLENKRF